MSNLYIGPSILSFGSFGQAVSEENIFRNQPIRNKNCLWWPCLLANRDEMCNIYRGPSIDASYQVTVHLAKRFQRRRIIKIGQSETRNVHSLERAFNRCFLPSFSSFGWGVSEEKIKMWKVNERQTTDDKRQVMAKAHVAFGKVS
jgi:hypothetical protein